jgi:hypothetical protein
MERSQRSQCVYSALVLSPSQGQGPTKGYRAIIIIITMIMAWRKDMHDFMPCDWFGNNRYIK